MANHCGIGTEKFCDIKFKNLLAFTKISAYNY